MNKAIYGFFIAAFALALIPNAFAVLDVNVTSHNNGELHPGGATYAVNWTARVSGLGDINIFDTTCAIYFPTVGTGNFSNKWDGNISGYTACTAGADVNNGHCTVNATLPNLRGNMVSYYPTIACTGDTTTDRNALATYTVVVNQNCGAANGEWFALITAIILVSLLLLICFTVFKILPANPFFIILILVAIASLIMVILPMLSGC